jgi:starch synthase (maltosyl-transferring)
MDGAILTASEVIGPRIRYVDLRRHDLAAAAARASEQGFTHVMIPPPWAHAPRGNLMLATDLSRPDAALGAGWSLEEAVLASALPLLLDVVVDSVACRSAAVAAGGGVFIDPDPADALDPRLAVDTDAAAARLATPADAAALGAFWEEQLAGWRASGVAGFRLIGLQACPPPLLKPLITALRRGAGSGLLLAWTPGMSRDAIAALAGRGLDGLFGSLPWWDFSSLWLWDECQVIRRAAPLIGCADVPTGRRLGAGSPARRRAAQSLAATIGSGWMDAAGDTGEHATCLNAWRRESTALSSVSAPLLPAGTSTPLLSLVRTDTGDLRTAERASLILINSDAALRRSLPASALTTALGGRFSCRAAGEAIDAKILRPQDTLILDPGEALALLAEAVPVPDPSRPLDTKAANAAAAPSLRLAIESVTPAVDDGAFPVKRTAGEIVNVEADVVFDGHEKIAVALRWRGPGDDAWQEVPMTSLGNDRWSGAFPLDRLGLHRFSIMAWKDRFATFRDELAKKVAAAINVKLECIEGEQLVRAAIKRSKSRLAAELEAALCGAELQAALLSDGLAALMARADDRPFATESAPMPVDAERIGARYANWYEIFPRSMSDNESRHGSFADVQKHLPRIRDMGFDVLYFPPIHPIGLKNRKGRNNTLTPAADDPGSPYAIGSADGGHDAIHPQLGTFADFRALREAAEASGIELAIDFAIQCSPDHPWLKNHPGWFDWRPDGTIRYAENPPKKYEDIVNVDFYAEAAIPDLWLALCDTVLFWAGHGVRLFRVDNPHTKAFPFWQWMIAEVKRRYPDAAFLAEAFTRPKIMYRPSLRRISPNLPTARRGTSSARTSLSTRPTSTHHSCRPPAGLVFSYARRWPLHSRAYGASIAASSFAKQHRCQGGRSISTARNTNCALGTGTGQATSPRKSPR